MVSKAEREAACSVATLSRTIRGPAPATVAGHRQAIGELVMEALSPVDPVAYIRIVLVCRNFREAKVF